MGKPWRLATTVSTAFIGLMAVSNTVSASTCEDLLVSTYQCSYVADDGTSGPFGATISNPVLGDGIFDLTIGGMYVHHCTCAATGTPLAPSFGRSPKSFFCSENASNTTSEGTVKRNKIVGQTYNTSGGVRSSYICTTGQPPPPPPPLQGYCCEVNANHCSMTTNTTTIGCTSWVANEACSGTGKCGRSARPGGCCEYNPPQDGLSCVANSLAADCSGAGKIFHSSAICTVNGCVP